jgi:trimethylamine--corrinoid protein Co-methyltransferase
MNAPTRRRRSAQRSAGNQGRAIPQLARRAVRNPYPPFPLLSADQVEAIHDASMRLLEETGIEVLSDAALDRFATAGAKVDRATKMVFPDRGLVAEKLATAPAEFTLTPRNRDNRVQLGGNAINFTLAAGPPNVHDRERGRRAGNMADYSDLVRLAQHFNAIHLLGNQVCAPIELPANMRHLDTYLANLTLTDKCFHVSAIGAGRALDGAAMMAIARGMTLEEMRGDPAVTTIISVNSPRRFDEAMAEGMMALSEAGQSVCVTPFTLMGAMSPVTLAGALAQQNAEALAGIALTQIVRPGAPERMSTFDVNAP